MQFEDEVLVVEGIWMSLGSAGVKTGSVNLVSLLALSLVLRLTMVAGTITFSDLTKTPRVIDGTVGRVSPCSSSKVVSIYIAIRPRAIT